ncbi:hypothetical protein [Methylobacterium gnaphalii]|uniref:Uncharacterized protein n=1 Tax=Methylobacterium gnaphalii TaxID=1010610 RepID=A0A512JGA2_9HYPH|nr:hypothetical protein [Methylobacterium gnaphalii]GEP08980.1 hypothetical protein MGN01_08250 [Methylobacterium gnaphalii]GJD67523.1 hypothetical protein MMMDOFMJ_0438 [Methylobacterium gnaphalii]GLS51422.1 hypothetical protein GCM10007885_42790 [Methylobacterium gnaphalii]
MRKAQGCYSSAASFSSIAQQTHGPPSSILGVNTGTPKGHRSQAVSTGSCLVEAGARGIEQTLRWLDTIEAQIDDGFERSLDVTELMAVPPAFLDSQNRGREL